MRLPDLVVVYPRIMSTDLDGLRLLATFGEVESVGTSMRKVEKLPLSNVAVFLAL
jgi:hypothetical protein